MYQRHPAPPECRYGCTARIYAALVVAGALAFYLIGCLQP